MFFCISINFFIRSIYINLIRNLNLHHFSNVQVSKDLGVLAGFPATMVMLFVIYFALKQSVHLALAISLGVVAWGIFLVAQKYIMAAFIS